MSTIKLSICIATFNRASCIGETLDSLIPQLTDEVEIVVLDGGSTDGTEGVMRHYAASCRQLRYVRQGTNYGVDRDFDRAVELAMGEYCWLMSDDDLFKPGAIRAVLDAMQDGRSLIIVNAEVLNKDFSKLIEARRLRFETNRTYGPNELDRLLRETGEYLTFIGCVVIVRSVWLERERAAYYGSLFIHVAVIFQRALPHEAIAIAQTLLSIRYGNAMWKPREFEIWMFKWPSLIWSLPGPSDSAKAALCPREPWRDLRRLVALRGWGAYSLQEFRRWIEPRSQSASQRAAARMVAITPGVLANGIALLYYSTVRRRSHLQLSDVKSSRFYFRNWLKGLRSPSRADGV